MPIRRRILLLSAPLALLAACGENPQQHFAQAQAAFAADDYAGARKHLIAALKDKPDDRAMLTLFARTLLRMHDPDGADVAIERLRRHGGGAAEIARFSAEAALLRGKPDKALALLGEDDDPAAWRIRATARLNLGDVAGATEAFERGMAAGNDIYLMADYARFRLDNAEIDAARAIAQRMRAAAPGAFETQMVLGQVAAARMETGAAVAAFRKAAETNPRRFEPVLAQADMLSLDGKTYATMALVAQADQLAPGEPRVLAMKLQLLSEKGDWARIRAMLQPREAGLDPQSPEGMTYGEALLRLGHTEQARMLFGRAVLLAPRDRHARTMLGEAQLAVGDAAGAWVTLRPLTQSAIALPRELELAEKAARLAGDDAADRIRARLHSDRYRAQVALAGNAQGAAARGDWEGAVAAYRKLLGFGADVEVLKGLVFASGRAGRASQAIGYADQALALDPDNAELLNLAGWTRLRARTDLSEAVQLLGRARDADPGNAEYAADLATAKAAAG